MKTFERFVVEKANKGNEPIKITNKNFERLRDMVSGKTDSNKLDLDILADRTDSKTGKVRIKALPGQNPTPSEISGQNKIITQQQPGTNTTIKTGASSNVSKPNVTTNNTVTTNTTPVRSGGRVKTTKPTITTNVSNPKRFKSFLDRVLVSTGVKTDPKYQAKFTTPSTNKKITVSGTQSGTNKVLKQVGKNALRSKVLRGLGRFAGGAFAAKDALDAARDERLLGRSRTSQVLAGLSKGLGGYLGGALGATLGTVGGGGIGSFALGTGGAITGYNLGSKLGDYVYNQGRKIVTGQSDIGKNLSNTLQRGNKTFQQLRKDMSNKINNANLRNFGRDNKDLAK